MTKMHGFEKWLVNRRGGAFYQRWISTLVGAAQLPLDSSSWVLELGAGNGLLSALLWERFHVARSFITDYDEAQVAVARGVLERRYGTLPESLVLETADATCLKYPEKSFDVVLAHLILHHVGDWEAISKALDEAIRVLKPGGRLVYAEFRNKTEMRAHLQEQGCKIVFRAKRWRILSTAETVVVVRP